MVQKLLCGAVVGHIAAPLARDQDLLTGLVGMLQHRYLMPLPHSGPRRHQPGRTGPHDQHLCHSGSSRNSLPVEICSSLSYQNRPAIAICIPLEKRRKAADSRVCRLGAPVKEGETVSAGQTLGKVGSVSCECAEESHIHLEVKQDDSYLDPAKLMQ